MFVARRQAQISPPDPRRHVVEFNACRGIGIVLVVYGHLERGLIDLGLANNAALLKICDFIIYTTHMPLFFLIAGFNASRSLQEQGRGPFLRSKSISVLYPYAVWSTLFVCSKRILSSSSVVNHPVAWGNILWIPLFPISIFWFLHALFMMQTVYAGFWRRKTLFLGVALLADLLLSVLGKRGGLPAAFEPAVSHLPFFAAGTFLSGTFARDDRWLAFGPYVLPFFLAFIAACIAVLGLGWDRPVSFVTLPLSAFGIAILFLVAKSVMGTSIGKWADWLGTRSLPIYLLHIFILPACVRMIGWIGWRCDLLWLPVFTAAGIAGSIVIYRIIGQLGLETILGFRTRGVRTGIRPRVDRRTEASRIAIFAAKPMDPRQNATELQARAMPKPAGIGSPGPDS